MPLSEATITALRAELQSLLDEQDGIELKIKAIKRLIGDDVSSDTKSQEDRTPLRDVILPMLEARGPMKAAQVTAILRDRDFQVSGKTDLHHRVYNELFRLMRSKVVNRRKTGEFELP